MKLTEKKLDRRARCLMYAKKLQDRNWLSMKPNKFQNNVRSKDRLKPTSLFYRYFNQPRRKLKVDDLYILTARQHQPLTCSYATSVNHKSTRHSQPAYLGCPLRFQAGFSFILHYNLIQLFLKHT